MCVCVCEQERDTGEERHEPSVRHVISATLLPSFFFLAPFASAATHSAQRRSPPALPCPATRLQRAAPRLPCAVHPASPTFKERKQAPAAVARAAGLVVVVSPPDLASALRLRRLVSPLLSRPPAGWTHEKKREISPGHSAGPARRPPSSFVQHHVTQSAPSNLTAPRAHPVGSACPPAARPPQWLKRLDWRVKDRGNLNFKPPQAEDPGTTAAP